MLKLRVLPRVNEDSVNIGFIRAPGHDVQSSVTLLDLSREELGNTVILGDRLVPASGTVIPSDDILISNVSVVRRDNSIPKPLYYTYTLGRSRYVVLLPDILSSEVELARVRLRNLIKLTRDDGSLATVEWDVGTPTYSSPGWVVPIYTDRKNDEDQTIWVQFDGWDTSTNEPARNHREVVNSTVISNSVSVTLANQDLGAGAMRFELSTSTQSDYAPAIAIFPNESSSPSVQVVGSTFTILDTPNINITIGTGVSTRDLVTAINSQTSKLFAVALNDSVDTNLVAGVYTTSTKVDGRVIQFSQLVRIRLESGARIRCRKPYSAAASNCWYPLVRNGAVTQTWTPSWTSSSHGMPVRGTGSVAFSVPEFSRQTWSPTYGQPYRGIVSEAPIVLDPTTIQARRTPIKSVSDVTVRLFGSVADVVKDIDLETGKIYLNTRVETRDDVTIDYTYKEEWYEYRGLDLNVLPGHNQDLLSKYVALYLVPSVAKLDTASPYSTHLETNTQRTVYHVIADTYDEAVARASSVIYRTNEVYPPAYSFVSGHIYAPTLLLGVFRVVQNKDIKESASIVDSRSVAGGRNTVINLEYAEAPEARMLADEMHWDGEPFPAGNVIIADLPDIRKASVTGYPVTFDATTGVVWADPSGRLLEEEIEQVLHQYASAGTLVIPEFNLEYSGE